MSISTGSYVNGQWTTRQMDIHQVLSQNRLKESTKDTTAGVKDPQPPPPPLMGILTQKLVDSPVVKWIIPARMRHKSKKDVVFVYDRNIAIKQIGIGSEEGAMWTVAMKTDFYSSIRSVGVIGLPTDEFEPLPEGQDAILKEESQDREPTVSSRLDFPPHMLVLALASRKLVFLTAFDDVGGQVQFVSREIELPAHELDSKQLGEYIAVDPKSRAMAVSALEGCFTLYALKSRAQFGQEIEANNRISVGSSVPVVARRGKERHIIIVGTILRMEFLHPPEGDDDHVILLMVVSSNRQSKLICWEWDCRNGLDTAQPKGSGQRIRLDEQLPLFLIPLTKSPAFILVCEKHITFYRDILTGNATAHTLPLHNLEPPEEPGSFKRLPLWTSWARSIRHKQYAQGPDYIYLCREDGVLRLLEIEDRTVRILDRTHRGVLEANIDTAFTSIDFGANEYDLLIAGGNMCDGGAWLLSPHQPANKKLNIPNWTPLIDFTVGDMISACAFPQMGSITKARQGQPRLFASVGKGLRHGAIVEIRYGVEACNKITITLPHAVVTQIWALEWGQGDSSSVLMLLSYPTATSLMILDSEGFIHNLTGENDTNIDHEARTIAAATTRSGLIIQVTNNSIRAVSPSLRRKFIHDEKNVMAAYVRAVDTEDFCAILIFAVENENGRYLCLSHVKVENQQIIYKSIGQPLLLLSEPSFISLEVIEEDFVAFVGTIESTIQMYHITNLSGLSPILEHKFKGQVPICDSVAILTQDAGRLLVCGLRNGWIKVFYFNSLSSDNDALIFCEKLQIGHTSVMVRQDITKTSRALILCEQKLYLLECSLDTSNGFQDFVNLIDVWLTDFDNPSFQQGKIDSFTQASSSFVSGWLLCVEGDQVHAAALSSELNSVALPRRLPVEGTPTRVIHSNRLGKLIVLYYKITSTRQPIGGYQMRTNQHFFEYMISLMDPNIDYNIKLESNDENAIKHSATISGKPGERFLGVMEWYPQGNNEVHHMLVVNTMIDHLSSHQLSGRLLFFSVSATGTLTLKKTIDKDGPVCSLAAYGSSSLIYCYGDNICLHKLEINSSGKKWQDPVILPIRSRGLHLSIHQDFVYVSTSAYGLAILKVEDGALVHQFNDEIARDDLYHLTLPEQSLILTSQKSRTITGIWQPPEKRIDNSTSTIFEAKLPGSITRFRRITRPLWQSASDTEEPSEAIIGCSTDGSMFQFEILDEPSWRLLAFIQNLAFRNPDICPHSDSIQAHRKALDPSPKNRFNMHVDGDVLQSLMTRGGGKTLLAMLGKDHIQKMLLRNKHVFSIMLALHLRHPDVANYQELGREELVEVIASREALARQEKFAQFAREVGLAGENEMEVVQKVVRWLRLKLRRAI